ncbi:MAG: hypothetical protein WKF30_19590 [Pyrinomonadaceae bacterium]
MQQQIQRLETISLAIAASTRAIVALREQLSIIEANHVLDVQGAMNEQNKAQYPNEEVRKAALTLRLADDETHRQLTLRMRDTESDRARHIAEHDRLRQEFKIYLLDRQEQIARMGEGQPAAGYPYR